MTHDRTQFMLEAQRKSFRHLAADNLRQARIWKRDVQMSNWFEGKAAAYKIAASSIEDLSATLRT